MKKLLFILLLTSLLHPCSLYAQSFEQVIKRFENKKGAEVMRVPGALMKLATAFMDDEKEGVTPEEKAFIKRINSMVMLNMDECSTADKEEFAQAMKTLKLDGFEAIDMPPAEDGTTKQARAFFHKGDKKNEMVVAIFDKEQHSIVLMRGKFDEESATGYASAQQEDNNKE